MSTKPKPDSEISELEYDMFEYPSLYPSGWNLEDVQRKSKVKKQPMPEGYEKFPQPKNFPDGWSLED